MNTPPENTATGSWFVYMVSCADDTLYTGITTNLDQRIAEHNEGGKRGARYTRVRRPVRLVYQWACDDRATAAAEEARIKKLSRSEKLLLVAEGGALPK